LIEHGRISQRLEDLLQTGRLEVHTTGDDDNRPISYRLKLPGGVIVYLPALEIVKVDDDNWRQLIIFLKEGG